MSDVRDAAGVSLRRLYSLYPAKRDLVAAWLDDRHHRWMEWFASTVARYVSEDVPPLLATFDALREWVRSPGYRGCAFLNAIAETSEIDDAHRAIVAHHKRALIDRLTTLATSPPGATGAGDEQWVPQAIAVLIDGAIVQSAVLGSEAPVEAARAAAARMLGFSTGASA